jgi:hypothetical protein
MKYLLLVLLLSLNVLAQEKGYYCYFHFNFNAKYERDYSDELKTASLFVSKDKREDEVNVNQGTTNILKYVDSNSRRSVKLTLTADNKLVADVTKMNKYTRAHYQTSEAGPKYSTVENVELKINGETTIPLQESYWADSYGSKKRYARAQCFDQDLLFKAVKDLSVLKNEIEDGLHKMTTNKALPALVDIARRAGVGESPSTETYDQKLKANQR